MEIWGSRPAGLPPKFAFGELPISPERCAKCRNINKLTTNEACNIKSDKMEIRINSVDYRGSIVDGPGIRTVLYIQGCEQRCEGCHNPNTWNIDGGKKVTIDSMVDEIVRNSMTKKITISGGEPLLQVNALLELILKLKSKNFNVALYTGYEIEDVAKELLKYLDYIKVGRYEKEKRCTTVDYIGSINQKFIDLKGEGYG